MRDEDVEFKREVRAEQNKRDGAVRNELEKLTQERGQLKLKRDEDERAFQELLYELEKKKEKEIRARVEKDQMRRALVELEKNKLSTLE
jgi:hypothetical protein